MGIVVDGYKPAVAMVCLQFIYSGLALFTKAALVQGMSPRVFVVYRQAVATLIMTPLACFSRWYGIYNHHLSLSSNLDGFLEIWLKMSQNRIAMIHLPACT